MTIGPTRGTRTLGFWIVYMGGQHKHCKQTGKTMKTIGHCGGGAHTETYLRCRIVPITWEWKMFELGSE